MVDNVAFRGLRVGFLSADELRRMAVVKVNKPATHERGGVPTPGGINDALMGVTESGVRCPTCRKPFCSGHIGIIELFQPVLRMNHIATVLALLRSTCWNCARLKVERDALPQSLLDPTLQPNRRLRDLSEFLKDRPCAHCKAHAAQYRRVQRIFIGRSFRSETLRGLDPLRRREAQREFEPADAQAVFRAMQPDEMKFLGFDPAVNPPDRLIMEIQVVAPPSIRPALHRGGTQTLDDLTRMLMEIVKANNGLGEALDKLRAAEHVHGLRQLRRRIESSTRALALASDDVDGGPDGVTDGGPHGPSSTTAVSVVSAVTAAPSSSSWESIEALLDEMDAKLKGPRDEVRIAREVLQARCAELIMQDVTRKVTIRGAERAFNVAQRDRHKRASVKDMRARLAGKRGRVRYNLRGKRVNMCARTVAGPDTSLNIWQIGVAREIMTSLTFPERVTSLNRAELQQRVRNGAKAYWGAKTVLQRDPDGATRDVLMHLGTMDEALRHDLADRLQIGWIIERHLRAGDHVLLNRQPTLHRQSLLACEIVPIDAATVDISLPTASPFNADFDGDEVNLHVPQSWGAMAEAVELMNVPYNIVSPQSNKPVIGLVQDSILALWQLTRKDTLVDVAAASQLAMGIQFDPRDKTAYRQPCDPYRDGSLWPTAAVLRNHNGRGRGAASGVADVGVADVGVADVGVDDDVATATAAATATATATVQGPTPAQIAERELAIEGLSPWPCVPAIIKSPKGPRFTGKQVFEWLLPPRLHLTGGEPLAPEDPNRMFEDKSVLVEDGELLMGRLSKPTLGMSAHGLVNMIYRDFGPWPAAKFISDAQRVAMKHLQTSSISIGLEDCLLSEAQEAHVRATIQEALAAANDELVKYDDSRHLRSLSGSALLGGPLPSEAETTQVRLLQAVMNKVGGEVLQDLSEKNGFAALVKCGARGNQMNIAQILGCIGQQTVEGRRFETRLHLVGSTRLSQAGLWRSLVSFAPGERRPESHGFITSTFAKGLSPREWVTHCRSGREGLVNTAVKTALTGYTQRRMMRALENLCATYDGSVRGASGEIVAFAYGADGYDAMQLEVVREPAPLHGVEALFVTHDGDHEDATAAADHNARMREAHAVLRDVVLAREPNGMTPNASFTSPFCMHRLLRRFGSVAGSLPHPLHHHVRPNASSHSVTVAHVVEAMVAVVAACTPSDLVGRALATVGLAWPRTRHLTRAQLRRVREEAIEAIERAKVAAGEAVGAVCAVSLGEPATQLTLDSFHYTGVAEKSTTVGLARLQELINAKDTKSTAIGVVRFRAPAEATRGLAIREQVRLPALRLEAVAASAVIVTQPIPKSSRSALLADDLFLLPDDPWATAEEAPGTLVELVRTSFDSMVDQKAPTISGLFRAVQRLKVRRWRAVSVRPSDEHARPTIRFELQPEALVARGLGPEAVAAALRRFCGPDADVSASEAIEPEWFVWVRLAVLPPASVTSVEAAAASLRRVAEFARDYMLQHVVLDGSEAVRRAFLREDFRVVAKEPHEPLTVETSWAVDTEGADLRAWAARDPDVVAWERCESNNVIEVLHTLGIEAARTLLQNEIRRVLSMDGTEINQRHTAILAERMCSNGVVAAITRHNMSASLRASLLSSAAFEQTLETIENGAAFGTRDECTDVTPCIMLGREPKIGASVFDVLGVATTSSSSSSSGGHDRTSSSTTGGGERAVEVLAPLSRALLRDSRKRALDSSDVDDMEGTSSESRKTRARTNEAEGEEPEEAWLEAVGLLSSSSSAAASLSTRSSCPSPPMRKTKTDRDTAEAMLVAPGLFGNVEAVTDDDDDDSEAAADDDSEAAADDEEDFMTKAFERVCVERNGRNQELELRFGRLVVGSSRSSRSSSRSSSSAAAAAAFVGGLDESLWTRVQRHLARDTRWDRTSGPHMTRDVLFQLTDGTRVRTTADMERFTSDGVMVVTHLHKTTLHETVVRLNSAPSSFAEESSSSSSIACCLTLAVEEALPTAELPATARPESVRMKRRWTYVRGPWAWHLTHADIDGAPRFDLELEFVRSAATVPSRELAQSFAQQCREVEGVLASAAAEDVEDVEDAEDA